MGRTSVVSHSFGVNLSLCLDEKVCCLFLLPCRNQTLFEIPVCPTTIVLWCIDCFDVFPGPNIVNATFFADTICWYSTSCDAICTVIVDGQVMGNISCSDGNLTVQSNLSSKTVTLSARDQLGQSVDMQVVPTTGISIPCYM